MAWRCSWQVTCELCTHRGPTRGVGSNAEKAAIKRGWLRAWGPFGAVHLCPECAKGDARPVYWPKQKAATDG